LKGVLVLLEVVKGGGGGDDGGGRWSSLIRWSFRGFHRRTVEHRQHYFEPGKKHATRVQKIIPYIRTIFLLHFVIFSYR
jgi:hypothetical protein